MANHHDVSIREYLEYQCDYAGVGLEAVTDRDIGLAILTPDYASQWIAIRGILQRNREVEDRASARIRELEADIQAHDYPQHWVDHNWISQMHDKTFLDAAHSMAAVGLIAPFVESLFGRIVMYFKDERTWKRSRRRLGIAKAFLQIAEDIDLKRRHRDPFSFLAPSRARTSTWTRKVAQLGSGGARRSVGRAWTMSAFHRKRL